MSTRTRPTLEQLFNLVDRAERHGGLNSAEGARLRTGLHHLAGRRHTDTQTEVARLRRQNHNLRNVAWRAKQRTDTTDEGARNAVRRVTALAQRWSHIPAKRAAAAAVLHALHPSKDTDD